MAITISNLSIGNTALAGTPIGVLTTTDASGTVIPCNYMLTKGSIGYFAIAGSDLVSAWSAPATPGQYSVRIRATGSDTMFSGSATFTVDIGMAAPPPPPLPSIQINGSTSPVTVSAGATISATVANGPGNPGDWLGVYAVGAPTVYGNPPSWKWLSTDDARGSIPPAPGVTAGTVHLVVPKQAGQYEVRFFSNNSFILGATSAAITVQITAPPPVPTSVTLTPASLSLPDDSPIGTPASTAAVAMSDGSAFAGVLSVSPVGLVMPTALNLVLGRALTTADDGSRDCTVTATQNGSSVSANLTLTITRAAPPPPPPVSPDGTTSAAPNGPALITTAGNWAWSAAASGRPGEWNINLNGSAVGVGTLMEVATGGRLYVKTANLGWYLWQGSGWVHSADPTSPPPPPAPMPTSVTLTPASLSLPDNSPAGTPASTAAVAMSDGSAFAGALTIGANNMVALAGSTVALTRALTAADDGAHSFLITATQNAGTASAALALNVAAVASPPTVIITVTPNTPQIPDTTSAGAVVASYTVTMSDGSPFVGTVGFGAPNFDAGGIFALRGSPASGNVIVSPTGPGVGPNLGTITDHITLIAMQP